MKFPSGKQQRVRHSPAIYVTLVSQIVLLVTARLITFERTPFNPDHPQNQQFDESRTPNQLDIFLSGERRFCRLHRNIPITDRYRPVVRPWHDLRSRSFACVHRPVSACNRFRSPVRAMSRPKDRQSAIIVGPAHEQLHHPTNHLRQAGGAEPLAIKLIRATRDGRRRPSAPTGMSLRRGCVKANINIGNFDPPPAANDL